MLIHLLLFPAAFIQEMAELSHRNTNSKAHKALKAPSVASAGASLRLSGAASEETPLVSKNRFWAVLLISLLSLRCPWRQCQGHAPRGDRGSLSSFFVISTMGLVLITGPDTIERAENHTYCLKSVSTDCFYFPKYTSREIYHVNDF